MMIHSRAARLTKVLFRSGWLLAVLLTGRLTAAPQHVDESALIDRVVDLVERRLAVMPEVAAVKFRQQQAIADPARERVVLDQSVAEARALHLEPEAARAFFSVQTGTRAELIQRTAITEGLRTLRQDGIEKVLAGHTSIEEVRASSNS